MISGGFLYRQIFLGSPFQNIPLETSYTEKALLTEEKVSYIERKVCYTEKNCRISIIQKHNVIEDFYTEMSFLDVFRYRIVHVKVFDMGLSFLVVYIEKTLYIGRYRPFIES